MYFAGIADLSPISGQFDDSPLTAADFQFSNALETVDPTTGLPPVPVAVPTTTPVASAGVSGTTLILALALGAAAYFYWPEIKAKVETYAR